MAKLEKVFAILLGLGLLLYLTKLNGGFIIPLIGGTLLSILYFPLGMARLNGISGHRIFSTAAYQELPISRIVFGGVLGLFLACALLGSVFYIANWKGSFLLSIFGSVGLTASLIAIILMRANLPGGGRPWIIRCVVALAVLVGVSLFPQYDPPPEDNRPIENELRR
ncbi:MAG: hypothetical protein H7330_09700 [Hymenobacteraceae bacterium]|nr:hypothetical protein [Hymenobacteraceae bacterium]